jgi:hypothetical protein
LILSVGLDDCRERLLEDYFFWFPGKRSPVHASLVAEKRRKDGGGLSTTRLFGTSRVVVGNGAGEFCLVIFWFIDFEKGLFPDEGIDFTLDGACFLLVHPVDPVVGALPFADDDTLAGVFYARIRRPGNEAFLFFRQGAELFQQRRELVYLPDPEFAFTDDFYIHAVPPYDRIIALELSLFALKVEIR